MLGMENLSPLSASSGESHSLTAAQSSRAYSRSYSNYHSSSSTMQGLPQQFVKSMRTLFNILDDTESGLVPLVEIERRWRDDAVPNLPGVLCALRSVAPPNGMLTFENFVCGLRMALSRARNGDIQRRTNNRTSTLQRASHIPMSRVPSTFQPSARQHIKSSNIATVNPSWSNENPRMSSHRPRPPLTTNLPSQNSFGFMCKSQREQPLRSKHRRSSSGPISTAKVFPHVHNPSKGRELESQDDIELEKSKNSLREMSIENAKDLKNISDQTEDGYAQKDSGIFEPSYEDDQEERKKIHYASAESISQAGNLDQITASTLCIDKATDSPLVSLQPVVVSGKYIGITGTLKRTKSSACITPNQYGSLKRPVKTTDRSNPAGQVTSISASCFNSLGRDKTLERPVKVAEEKTTKRPNESKNFDRGNYVRSDHATEQAEFVKRKLKNFTKKIAGVKSDGTGRWCDSSSPPDNPTSTSLRVQSSNAKIEIPKLPLSSSPESNSASSGTSPNSSSQSQKQQSNRSLPRPGSLSRNVSSDKLLSSSSSGCGNFISRRRANSASSIKKRRDPRRHTVTTGIDYNLLKYTKQIELEKDMLLKGIKYIENCGDWFQSQLSDLKSRQQQLNSGLQRSSQHSDKTLETNNKKDEENYTNSFSWDQSQLEKSQKKIDHLKTTVQEFEKILKSLSHDKEQKGNSVNLCNADEATITTLKEHNQLLTKEVSEKSQQISQLEKEKSALVQQLFQARAEIQKSQDHANTSIFI